MFISNPNLCLIIFFCALITITLISNIVYILIKTFKKTKVLIPNTVVLADALQILKMSCEIHAKQYQIFLNNLDKKYTSPENMMAYRKTESFKKMKSEILHKCVTDVMSDLSDHLKLCLLDYLSPQGLTTFIVKSITTISGDE